MHTKRAGYWRFSWVQFVSSFVLCSFEVKPPRLHFAALYHCSLHSRRHTLLDLTHCGLIRLNHFRLCSQSLITFALREVSRRCLSPSLWFFPPFFSSLCHLPFFLLGDKGGKQGGRLAGNGTSRVKKGKVADKRTISCSRIHFPGRLCVLCYRQALLHI